MPTFRLTPAEARAKFGCLTFWDGGRYAHFQFTTREGCWKPEYDAFQVLTGYRLHPGEV